MNAIRAFDTGKGCFDHDAPGVAEFLISNFDVHANDQHMISFLELQNIIVMISDESVERKIGIFEEIDIK